MYIECKSVCVCASHCLCICPLPFSCFCSIVRFLSLNFITDSFLKALAFFHHSHRSLLSCVLYLSSMYSLAHGSALNMGLPMRPAMPGAVGMPPGAGASGSEVERRQRQPPTNAYDFITHNHQWIRFENGGTFVSVRGMRQS